MKNCFDKLARIALVSGLVMLPANAGMAEEEEPVAQGIWERLSDYYNSGGLSYDLTQAKGQVYNRSVEARFAAHKLMTDLEQGRYDKFLEGKLKSFTRSGIKNKEKLAEKTEQGFRYVVKHVPSLSLGNRDYVLQEIQLEGELAEGGFESIKVLSPEQAGKLPKLSGTTGNQPLKTTFRGFMQEYPKLGKIGYSAQRSGMLAAVISGVVEIYKTNEQYKNQELTAEEAASQVVYMVIKDGVIVSIGTAAAEAVVVAAGISGVPGMIVAAGVAGCGIAVLDGVADKSNLHRQVDYLTQAVME